MVYQLPHTYHFACPQEKQMGSLFERGLKTAGTHMIKNLESSPLQYCNPHLRSPNHKSTLYHILA